MSEELIKRLAIFVDHFKFADDSKRGEAMSLLTELAAIKSQPVPVEPDVWEVCGEKWVRKEGYDSLQSALQVAQQERDTEKERADRASRMAQEGKK